MSGPDTSTSSDAGGYKYHRPLIVLAHIGQYVMSGVKEAAEAAGKEALEHGYNTKIVFIQDLSFWLHMGILAMKNFGLMKAIEAGADHAVLLDNDVVLGKDSLWLLASRNAPIVSPIFLPMTFLKEGEYPPPLSHPSPLPDQGLVSVVWVASGCLMFSKTALSLLGPTPFTDAHIAHIEEYDHLKWKLQGADTFMDTDVHVTLLREPKRRSQIESEGPLKPPGQRAPAPADAGYDQWAYPWGKDN